MRYLFVALLVLSAGCSTVQIPSYISAQHPYSRRIYAGLDEVKGAVRSVLVKEGFHVQQEASPDVYEHDARVNKDRKGALLFTDVKQYSRILYSKYVHLNVFMYELADGIEVELRYGRVTSVLFAQMKSARNDGFAQKLLDQIEAKAGK